ncbi:MAG: tetratricopeptide repeat protein, partial [bacterium]
LAAFVPTMLFHFPLHLAACATIFWVALGIAAGPAVSSGAPAPRPGWFALAILAAAVAAGAFTARDLTAQVLLRGGYDRFRGGAAAAASPYFERFERLASHDYEERFYAGALWQALGDHGRAVDGYERALVLYPGMQGAAYNYGNALFARRNYPEAIRLFGRALEINPCFADAFSNRGNAYALLGRRAEARRDYLRALELKPGYADAMYNLAVDAWGAGQRGEAARWLRRALAAEPRHAAARELLATMELK